MNAYEYDEYGDPVIAPADRILRALRFHDWIEPTDLYDQLGFEPGSLERAAHMSALSRLIKLGRVERRMTAYYSETKCRRAMVATVRLAKPTRLNLERMVEKVKESR